MKKKIEILKAIPQPKLKQKLKPVFGGNLK